MYRITFHSFVTLTILWFCATVAICDLTDTDQSKTVTISDAEIPTVMGKLIFKKLEINYKRTSGFLPMDFCFYSSPIQHLKCSKSLDVFWSSNAIAFMKKQGLLQNAVEGFFDDVVWDGKYLWAAVHKTGILLLDTSGEKVFEINSENGLLPAENALKLHAIENGKVIAVGSFGPEKSAWCAVITFENNNADIDIFHQAKRVKTDADNIEELEKDPNVAFAPSWIREYIDPENNKRTLIVARCEKKYRVKSLVRYPLEIDPETLNVRISPYDMLRNNTKTSPYGVECPLVEHGGYIYNAGRIWNRQRSLLDTQEKLIESPLPEPYSKLDNLSVSAHYGLLAWNNHSFYQVIVTEDTHDVIEESLETGFYEDGYFHTFTFMDGDNVIKDSELLDLITIYADPKISQEQRYSYKDYKLGGYFPLGTYKIVGGEISRGWPKKTIKCGPFEPIEVTEESPENLVFKPVSLEDITYRGRVVHAITGQPISDALVTLNTFGVSSKENWNCKTDNDGRFEAAFKPTENVFSFTASKENYMRLDLEDEAFNQVEDYVIDIDDFRLFPAANIEIYPCIELYNLGLPCIEARNTNLRLEIIADPNDENDLVSTFRQIYEDRSGSLILPQYPIMNETEIYQVPAGFSYKTRFRLLFEQNWILPEIPTTINLQQGETLRLGKFVFEPAAEVYVKLINAEGNPLGNIKFLHDFENRFAGGCKTDSKGDVTLYVDPKRTNKFNIYSGELFGEQLGTITLDISGTDKARNEFFITFNSIDNITISNSLQKPDESKNPKPAVTNELTDVIFSTGIGEADKPIDNVKEIHLSDGNVFIFTYWLLSLEGHEYKLIARDASGNIIYEYKSHISPYQTVWNLWNWHEIDIEKYVPGKWKYEIYMDGEKFDEKYLEVLPGITQPLNNQKNLEVTSTFSE